MTILVPDHGETAAIVYPAADPPLDAALVLAHGAGAGQHGPFMTDVARALARRGLDVLTFDFLYMHRHRRLPDRAPLLEACWRAAIAAARAELASASRALVIGGKSMGARVATQVAAADARLPIAGLVLLGYPLHPPGRPDQRRDRHLPQIHRPMLVVQGSRDAFGTPAELAPVLNALDPPATLHVVEGGDHSLTQPRATRGTRIARQASIHDAIAQWVRRVTGSAAPSGRPHR